MTFVIVQSESSLNSKHHAINPSAHHSLPKHIKKNETFVGTGFVYTHYVALREHGSSTSHTSAAHCLPCRNAPSSWIVHSRSHLGMCCAKVRHLYFDIISFTSKVAHLIHKKKSHISDQSCWNWP